MKSFSRGHNAKLCGYIQQIYHMYYQKFNHFTVTLYSPQIPRKGKSTLNARPCSRNLMASKEEKNSTHTLHLHYKLGYDGLATTLETEM